MSCACTSLYAQKFAYDVDLDFNFDNREYDHSSFAESMTIFSVRLTPAIGLDLDTKDGSNHDIMIGIDIMKDFGASPVSPEIHPDPSSEELSKKQNNWDLFRELVLYYKWTKKIKKTDFSLTAGIFPRKFSKSRYSTAFFSDSLRFYDNNYEGLLLSFGRPEAHYEIGCDWMGKYGVDRRERFMIFSAGEARPADLLTLGYSAYLYHFAGAENVQGVVDNALINPYIGLDFSKMARMQELYFSLGWLQSMQNDRRNVGKYVFPGGGECNIRLRNWNVGIDNRFFYGTDMMPYYNREDAAGCKYGNLLYQGDPFYRIKENGAKGWGIYDRLEVYYQPKISDFLSLKVSVVLHFNQGFSGWQQCFGLNFNLQSLLSRTGKKS